MPKTKLWPLLAIPIVALSQLSAPDTPNSEETAKYLERAIAALLQDAGRDGRLFESTVAAGLTGSVTAEWNPQPMPASSSVRAWQAAAARTIDHDGFAQHLRALARQYGSTEKSRFRCVAMEPGDTVKATILYEIGGAIAGGGLRQYQGVWLTTWGRTSAGGWQLASLEEKLASKVESDGPLFEDVTQRALGGSEAFRKQLSQGTAHWAATLDVASGIDFYALNGIAIGDYDGDGWEDFYVWQPGGLPNRLFRNQGDGTFVDVTAETGLGILDSTSSALWADFRNTGRQDLLVVATSGLLLFENEGGRFRKASARFTIPADQRGTMMMAALADYDMDGFLDIFVCQYSASGTTGMANLLDQPVPYYDANNGAANHLFRNNRDGTFTNVTRTSGLNANNSRWSFAAAWGDYDDDGDPDLYVANDFGRNNLYRNHGDGTFTDVAAEAGVEDVGAGMSASWGDYDNDGRFDLYVSNIWSAAGQRIMSRKDFQPGLDETARSLMRRFAEGNTLFRNRGDGTFENATPAAGVANGGWAWASGFLDADNDGSDELLVTNGQVTGNRDADLEDFHWSELVGASPAQPIRSSRYERAWREFQKRMMESGWSVHGRERNRFFANSGGGALIDISALSGLDFSDDGRAFGVTDLDNDGQPDVLLKNRTAPQIRVMRNTARQGKRYLDLTLAGKRSNRDAIGARVTVRCGGETRQKEVQAGSGFLSQHSRRLHFGLGRCGGPASVRIQWPGGPMQALENVPIDRHLRVEEGAASHPAVITAAPPAKRRESPNESSSEVSGAWFVEAMPIPLGNALGNLRGSPAIVHVPEGMSSESLKLARAHNGKLEWRPLAVSPDAIRAAAIAVGRLFLIPPNVAGPFSLLLDAEGLAAKVYWGRPDESGILADLSRLPGGAESRLQLALPFPGQLHGGSGSRLETFYRIALDCLDAGLDEAALEYFQRCTRIDPRSGSFLGGVGTVYVRQKRLAEAVDNFERAAALDPGSVPTRFNLGTTLAMLGRFPEAVASLRQAAGMDSASGEIWANLGNAYLDMGDLPNGRQALERALVLDPQSAMLRNSLGTLYAELGSLDRAEAHLLEAIRLKPDYEQAYLNLGLLFLHKGDRARAARMLMQCLQLNPANADARRLMERTR